MQFVIALLLAVLVLQACMALRKLSRIITMSETIDTELSEIDTKVATLTTTVQVAADKFADLAAKLQAAIDGQKQQGLTDAQLAEFTKIKGELDGASSSLLASAQTADPDPAPNPVVLNTTALPDAVTGQPYKASLDIEGGTGPYKVTTSPASDNGISFSDSGAVSGTPAADGDSTFHVNVEDSSVPPLSASGDVTLHSATPTV